MPVSNEAVQMQIAKSKKVLAITKGFAVVLIVISMFSTAAATMLILSATNKVTDKILDCVLPEGSCYQEKVRDANRNFNVDTNVIVNFCSIKHRDNIEQAKACVRKELSNGVSERIIQGTFGSNDCSREFFSPCDRRWAYSE